MNTQKLELGGQRFGKLLVVSEINKRTASKKIQWNCICDCGSKCVVSTANLRNGYATSCGCYRRMRASESMKKTMFIHGYSKKGQVSPEFNAWSNMKDRCSNPKSKPYKNYGGRGIKVCDRWLNSFKNFLDDMGERPSAKHSLDRIDNNGNYEPSNCRWATIIQQSSNNRKNKYLEYKGLKMIQNEWARKLKIDKHSISYRLNRNIAFSEIVEYFAEKNNILI